MKMVYKGLSKLIVWTYKYGVISIGVVALLLCAATKVSAQTRVESDAYRLQGRALKGFAGTKPESQIAAEREQARSTARPQEQAWQYRSATEQNVQWDRREEKYPQWVIPMTVLCRPTVQQVNRKALPEERQAERSEFCIKQLGRAQMFILFEPLEDTAGRDGDPTVVTFKFFLKDGTAIYKQYPSTIRKSSGDEVGALSIDGKYAAKDVIKTVNLSMALTYYYKNKDGQTKAVDVLLPGELNGLFLLERN